jgi:transposase
MIEQEKRKAVYHLHLEGVSIRKISRQLRMSRNTVRTIIAQKGEMPQIKRADRKEVDPQLSNCFVTSGKSATVVFNGYTKY